MKPLLKTGYVLPLAAGTLLVAGIAIMAGRDSPSGNDTAVRGSARSEKASQPVTVAQERVPEAVSGRAAGGSLGEAAIASSAEGGRIAASSGAEELRSPDHRAGARPESRHQVGRATASTPSRRSSRSAGKGGVRGKTGDSIGQESQAGVATGGIPLERPAVMPLAWEVTDEQVAEIAPDVPPEVIQTVRQQFNDEAGSEEPEGISTPDEKVDRWNDAQRAAENRIRALYGWAAFAEFQRQAALAQAQAGQ